MRILGVLAVAALLGAATAQPMWKATEIGGSEMYQANQIGNDGTTIGFGTNGSHGMVWSADHGVNEIPPIPGTLGSRTGHDVNGQGQVAGQQHTDLGGGRSREEAFVWDRNSGTREFYDFGSSQAWAFGISNAGHVVGRAWGATKEGYVWHEESGLRWLPRLPGMAWAEAHFVNSSGMIVGLSGDQRNTAIWDTDGSVNRMQEPVGYGQTDVDDLNDRGFMTGITDGPRGSKGYLRDPDGNYTIIQNPFDPRYYTWGLGLNVHNEVVGRLSVGNSVNGGFYWSDQTGTLNLTDHLAPGYQNWRIGSAQSINDRGQIVGWGYDNGRLTAVLLEQVVPEPSTFVVLALGLASVAARRRRIAQ